MTGAVWVLRSVVGLGVALACAGVAPTARAAGDRPKTIYYKWKSFRVPFNVDPADRPRLKEIQLWVSQDKGLVWEFYGHVPPDQPNFPYKAPRDGEYWFTVRTKDNQGVLHPSNDKDVTPGLAVIVDTTPPTIELRSRTRRGTKATVGWEIKDKNLDPTTLVLEVQEQGASSWRRVPIERTALIGSASLDTGTLDAVQVRATVADRAGNEAREELTLPQGTEGGPSLASNRDPSDFAEPPPIRPASTNPRRVESSAPDPIVEESSDPAPADDRPVRASAPESSGDGTTLLVGSPRFPLQYAVDDAGDTGPETVELWMTADRGQNWTSLGRDPDRRSPFLVELGADGVYGLKLVAKGTSGLGDPPPVPGEAPQTFVELDTTEPEVKLNPPQLAPGSGRLAITWRANDLHLKAQPVVISYRPDRPDRPDALWQEIAGPLPNNGRFEWPLPANVAPRFQIKVDVLDEVGNAGKAISAPVTINRARPKSRIIGLDPSARANGRALR